MINKLLFSKGIIIFSIAIVLFSSSCSIGGEIENPTNIEDTVTTQEAVTDVESTSENASDVEEKADKVVEAIPTEEEILRGLVANMTLEEKVGQMFIVQPEVFSTGGTVTSIDGFDTESAKKYKVGGFALFADNILNPSQVIELNSELYGLYEDIKPFIAVDEEGGQVSRIGNNPNFPDEKQEYASALGTRLDYDGAYESGDYIGAYLKKYGFNLDFAPVGDVLLSDENMVVKYRSFGSDPKVVSDMVLRVLEGLHNNNILASAKHFPGHGSTADDTHVGFATSNSTREEMEVGELLPFKALIEKDVDMVMISHVIYPNLSEELVPATLNYDIVTKLLKEDLGYNGVVITDAMNMGAIANNYSVEEATVKSVQAGVDIVLMPKDFYGAYEALLSSVKDGIIPIEQIDESVYKILKLKSKFDSN